MTMSAQLMLPLWSQSTSSASEALAKTSVPRAQVLALEALRAAFSTTAFEYWKQRDRAGSCSKTLLRALLDGSTLSGQNWNSSDMQRYRSRLRRVGSALGRNGREYLLLPALTATQYGSNRGGAAGRTGPERPSLQSMARQMLPTLTETGNLLSPSMQKWPRHSLLQALCRRNERGPGPAKKTRGGKGDLPQTIGGHLDPTWCEWFMGAPEGWTELDPESLRLVMRQRRSKSK